MAIYRPKAVENSNARQADGKTAANAFRAVFFGAVAGAVACAVLLGAFSLAFVSAENIPQFFLSPLVIGISVFSSFLAGFIAAKISRKHGLIYGTFAGLFLFVLFLAAGLATENQAAPDMAGTRLLTMLLSGAVGGVLAVGGHSR